ncbi:MAG: hypothetical protein JNK61_04945 [Bacteroidia bacterium]|nr:hypothetical protein [Bacteroidia bacterium]HQU99633.1 hypothetical protein [Bacteroidia bacterium]
MNIWGNKIIAIATCILLVSCEKEVTYVYDVNTVTVSAEGSNKPNVKTTAEFISIAYSDLLGKAISNAEQQQLNVAYNSFGDNKLIEDLIIKNLLQKPGAQIPSKASMLVDVDSFISNTYKKFYNRNPNAFEMYFMHKLITTNNTITPTLIYYAFMTSNEYRYY